MNPPTRNIIIFVFLLQCYSCLVAYNCCCEAFSILSRLIIYQNIHDSAITTSSAITDQSRSSFTHQHERITRSGSNIASSLFSTLSDEGVVPSSVLNENENGEPTNDEHYLLPNTWIIQWR